LFELATHLVEVFEDGRRYLFLLTKKGNAVLIVVAILDNECYRIHSPGVARFCSQSRHRKINPP